MTSLLRRLAPFIAAAVVLAPLVRDPHDDSYPLSTYPMFATDRGAIMTIDTVVVIDHDGNVGRLSPKQISGTDEIVSASVVVSSAIRRGEADLLCADVAARLDDNSLIVQVRSVLVDTSALVVDNAEPISVEVRAECQA